MWLRVHFVNSTDAHIKQLTTSTHKLNGPINVNGRRHKLRTPQSLFLFSVSWALSPCLCRLFPVKLADIGIASMTLTEIHIPRSCARKTRGATGRQTVRALTSHPLPELLLLLQRPLISPAVACPHEAPGPSVGVSSGRCRRRPGPPQRSAPRTARTSGARTP